MNTCAEKGFPNILYSGISFWSNFTDCVFEEGAWAVRCSVRDAVLPLVSPQQHVPSDMGACPTGAPYNWKKNGEPCFQATCQVSWPAGREVAGRCS